MTEDEHEVESKQSKAQSCVTVMLSRDYFRKRYQSCIFERNPPAGECSDDSGLG